MAVTVPARNKKHPGRRDRRNEKGIVVSPADHFEKWESMLAAGIRERRTHFRSATRPRIRIHQLPLYRDFALRGNFTRATRDPLPPAIAPGPTRTPQAQRYAHTPPP